jgi:hypothetical protein
MGGDCNRPDQGGVLIKMNPLIGVSFDIQGEKRIGQGSFSSWWSANGQLPGTQISYKGYIYVLEKLWFFGDVYSDSDIELNIWTNNITDSKGNGGWEQGIPTSGPTSSGTWSASIVPLPSAVWLFVSGLVPVCIFKRKKDMDFAPGHLPLKKAVPIGC